MTRDIAVVVDVVAGLGAESSQDVVLVGVLGQRVPGVGAQAGVDPGGHLTPPPLALPVVLPLPGRRVPQRRRQPAAPAAAPHRPRPLRRADAALPLGHYWRHCLCRRRLALLSPSSGLPLHGLRHLGRSITHTDTIAPVAARLLSPGPLTQLTTVDRCLHLTHTSIYRQRRIMHVCLWTEKLLLLSHCEKPSAPSS